MVLCCCGPILRALDRTRVNLLARLATVEELRSNPDSALRFAAYSVRLAIGLEQPETGDSVARMILALAAPQSVTQLAVKGHDERVRSASLSPDGAGIVTVSLGGPAWVSDVSSGKMLRELADQGERIWVQNGALMGRASSPSQATT